MIAEVELIGVRRHWRRLLEQRVVAVGIQHADLRFTARDHHDVGLVPVPDVGWRLRIHETVWNNQENECSSHGDWSAAGTGITPKSRQPRGQSLITDYQCQAQRDISPQRHNDVATSTRQCTRMHPLHLTVEPLSTSQTQPQPHGVELHLGSWASAFAGMKRATLWNCLLLLAISVGLVVAGAFLVHRFVRTGLMCYVAPLPDRTRGWHAADLKGG